MLSLENDLTASTAEMFEVVGRFLKCLGLLSQVSYYMKKKLLVLDCSSHFQRTVAVKWLHTHNALNFVAHKGDSYMLCFPDVLAVFHNYLPEVSFDPKMPSQLYSTSSHKSVRIVHDFFDCMQTRKKGGGWMKIEMY